MRAEAPTKPWPIVQSVVDFAPPSKTRGAELIPVSENPCLNIAHSDCFAALCAACAGAQEGDLHRVEGNRAASRRSRGSGHPRVGGLDDCDWSAAQKAVADDLQQRWPFGSRWSAVRRSGRPRQQVCQRSSLRRQRSFAWRRSYQHRGRLCTCQQLDWPPVVARSAGCRRRHTCVHAGVRCARAPVCELVMSVGKKQCSVTGSDPKETRTNIKHYARRSPSRAPAPEDEGHLWCKQPVASKPASSVPACPRACAARVLRDCAVRDAAISAAAKVCAKVT